MPSRKRVHREICVHRRDNEHRWQSRNGRRQVYEELAGCLQEDHRATPDWVRGAVHAMVRQHLASEYNSVDRCNPIQAFASHGLKALRKSFLRKIKVSSRRNASVPAGVSFGLLAADTQTRSDEVETSSSVSWDGISDVSRSSTTPNGSMVDEERGSIDCGCANLEEHKGGVLSAPRAVVLSVQALGVTEYELRASGSNTCQMAVRLLKRLYSHFDAGDPEAVSIPSPEYHVRLVELFGSSEHFPAHYRSMTDPHRPDMCQLMEILKALAQEYQLPQEMGLLLCTQHWYGDENDRWPVLRYTGAFLAVNPALNICIVKVVDEEAMGGHRFEPLDLDIVKTLVEKLYESAPPREALGDVVKILEDDSLNSRNRAPGASDATSSPSTIVIEDSDSASAAEVGENTTEVCASSQSAVEAHRNAGLRFDPPARLAHDRPIAKSRYAEHSPLNKVALDQWTGEVDVTEPGSRGKPDADSGMATGTAGKLKRVTAFSRRTRNMPETVIDDRPLRET